MIDEAFGKEPDFDFEEAFEDPYGDFRMHFMTWDFSQEQLFRCFEVLPHGREMCERVIEMRTLYLDETHDITEAEAIHLFQTGLTKFASLVDDDDLRKPIRVQYGTTQEMVAIPADRVAVVLEDLNWGDAFPRDHGYACRFLTETLYRAASNYDVIDYIRWPLFPDPNSIDLYREFALIGVTSKYFALLDSGGPLLFVDNDRR